MAQIKKPAKLDVDGSEIVWHEIDPATLKGDQLKAWHAYKALYKQASDQRAMFETLLRKEADLPAGRRLVVGYNFGKLSVSNMVDTGEGTRTSKRAVSLRFALS